jgi:integrase
MAKRPTKRLDSPTIRALAKPGRYADGEGLYLIVDENGSKRWVFLFRWQGKLKEMGLGGLSGVGLAKAREKAREAREQLADGINPIEARKALAEVPTFGKMADELVAVVEKTSRNAKHVAGWRLTLTTHAAPLRDKLVSNITTDDVLGVLRPLTDTIPETASRLRGRIERVLDAAKAKGHRQGENPARWRGHLEHFLPRRQKLARGHHAAMPFPQVPAFVAELRERGAMAALGLEFSILNTNRPSEVLGARVEEVDFAAKVWTIPAERMKGGRVHRVPLTDRSIEILEKAAALAASNRAPGGYLFPGPKKKGSLEERSLSTNAFRALMIRMQHGSATPHGFRSSFRDWCGEASTFPRELAEAALAHLVGDETERAYRRGDALAKRRKLMEAWAAYVAHGASAKSNVRPMVRGAA